MKIDVSRPLTLYNGEPVRIDGKESEQATLGELLELAITNTRDPDFATGPKKYDLFKLLTKIHGAEGEVDIKAEDVATLKTLAGGIFGVAVVGAVYDALEGRLEVVPADGGKPRVKVKGG